MVFVFHELPFDLCREVLWTWVVGEDTLQVEDIRSLDIAYCCRGQRKSFLSWIQNMPLRLDIPSLRDDLKLLSWITARKLRIKDLRFTNGNNDKIAALEKMTRESDDRMDWFGHLQTVHATGRQLSSLDRLFLGRLYSSALAVQHFYLHISFCSVKDIKKFLRQLPNPHLLRSMSTAQWIGLDCEDDKPWWTLTPYLTKLSIYAIEKLPCSMLHRFSSALPDLEEISFRGGIRSGGRIMDDTPRSTSSTICFSHLKQLNLFDMKFSPEFFIELLNSCPTLVSLELRDVELTSSIMQQEAITVLLMKVPHLQHFYWKNSVSTSVESDFYLDLRALNGETLSVFNNCAPVVCPTDWTVAPLALLDYLSIVDKQELISCNVDLFIYLSEPADSSFWTTHARAMAFVTTLFVSDSSDYTSETWNIILALPRLKIIHVGSDCVGFEVELAECESAGVQSNVSRLYFEDASLSSDSNMAQLLLTVFPKLTQLRFKKADVAAEDLLLLFRLPHLQSLKVEDDSDCPLSGLDDIEEVTWAEMAENSSCTKLALTGLRIESWPAVRRMVDSPMGLKLRKLYIYALDYWEDEKWRELLKRESAYLSCPGRCRILVMNL